MTTIKANKDLYNRGKCFSKGRTYEVRGEVTKAAALIDLTATNDQGEPHIIGNWWRNFTIVRTN